MRKLMLALLLVSCGEGAVPAVYDGSHDVLVEPPAPTLASRLAEGVQLFVLPTQSGAAIEARQVPLPFERIRLQVTSGTIHLSASAMTGEPRLDWLQLRFADVALFDSGLTLTDLRLTAEPTDAPQLRTTVSVAGSWRGPSGVASPFETQRFENVPIAASLALDDEAQVNAHFRLASFDAPSFRLDGFFETGAAILEVTANERGVVPHDVVAGQ